MAQFNAESTTDEVMAGVSLDGKLVVITGASSGLGLESARVMAAAGAKVVLLARSEEKLAAAVATLGEQVPDAQFDSVIMDLADLDSVRAAADTLLQRYPGIDLLLNNAGVMICPEGRTEQGFETQFGTNHLGHFLLTCLLTPALIAAAPARVVVLSSGAHKLSPVNLDDPNYRERDYDKWLAYGESKTANALFALALDARLKAHGVRANSVHPGIIMTELGRHFQPEDFAAMAEKAPKEQNMSFKSIPQGAATSVWAATAPELADVGGLYLEDCHIAPTAVAGGDGGVESYAQDPAVAEQLWTLSEDLVGQSFKF